MKFLKWEQNKMKQNWKAVLEVPPTAFRTETLILTLTFNLDLQTSDSYGHDPYYRCKGQG